MFRLCDRFKKRCKMKKEYFKPVTVTVELTVENFMLNDSNRIPVGGQDKPSAAGSSRGEWGNLWK